MVRPVEIRVPVSGGELAMLRWPGNGPVVLAAHGISSNAAAWGAVADALGGSVDLVAPDLRGRGGSVGLAGPYGIRRHASDLIAVLDHLQVGSAVLAGHSMGGFVCTAAATAYPDRVTAVVLVDGGLRFAVPVDADVDRTLDRVLGPTMRRLDRTFGSAEELLALWRAHPALGPYWSAAIEAYAWRDVAGEAPAVRSAVRREAVRVDGAQIFGAADVHAAVHRLPCPGVLLWAGRGMVDEPGGLYDRPERDLAGTAVRVLGQLDANHFTVLLGPAGAAAVAAEIRRAAPVPPG